MFGRNSFRVMPSGPLRRMADGGLFSGVGKGLEIIGKEFPKWWDSDETADLRRGLRQTGLGVAYTALPMGAPLAAARFGIPFLEGAVNTALMAPLAPTLYDVFAKGEDEALDNPTPGGYDWIEKSLGRDLRDPVEKEMALASGLSQMTPIAYPLGRWAKNKLMRKPVQTSPNAVSPARDVPEVVDEAFEPTPAMQKFLEL